MIRKAVCVVLLWALFIAAAFANTVNMAWDRMTLSDLAGFNVYRGTIAGGPYTKVNGALVPQPAAGVPSYSDQAPGNSTFFYVIRAVNTAGLESANSNEVVAMPIPPPPPTNLRIVSVETTVNLFVDQNKVATGPPPLKYILPRQTPPRAVPLTVTVGP